MNETRESYVRYWARMGNRSRSDVYVPRSLQPDLCFACGWVRTPVTRVSSSDGPGNHTGCSRGKW